MITRRGLVTGLVGIIAAPAIVRASSLMPVRAVDPEWLDYRGPYELEFGTGPGTLVTVTYKIVSAGMAQLKPEGTFVWHMK